MAVSQAQKNAHVQCVCLDKVLLCQNVKMQSGNVHTDSAVSCPHLSIIDWKI